MSDSNPHAETISSGAFAGLFSGTTNFNVPSEPKTLTARGETDIYIAKYTLSGALLWLFRRFPDRYPCWLPARSYRYADL